MNGFFKDIHGKPLFLAGLQAHNSSTGTDMIPSTARARRGCI